MRKDDLGEARGGSCDQMSRRQALRVGSKSLFGCLTLPGLMELQAQASTAKPGKAENLIFIFLEGSPSHIDMWDLKPQAPREVRGPYRQISTALPGVQIGEHLPNCAKALDKMTILRSHSHNDNGHTTGFHYVCTGYRVSDASLGGKSPLNNLYPSLGSIVTRELVPRSAVTVPVQLPNSVPAGGPGFHGAEQVPFVVGSHMCDPDFYGMDMSPT